MTKEQLAPWIEKLNQAEKKERKGIVAEMCREHGLKTGDAWNLLRDAGFDSGAAADDTATGTAEKTTPVRLRHKTEYPRYRCAGLVLTSKPETYQVSASQQEKLKRDPWVEIVQPDGADTK